MKTIIKRKDQSYLSGGNVDMPIASATWTGHRDLSILLGAQIGSELGTIDCLINWTNSDSGLDLGSVGEIQFGFPNIQENSSIAT